MDTLESLIEKAAAHAPDGSDIFQLERNSATDWTASVGWANCDYVGTRFGEGVSANEAVMDLLHKLGAP